MNPQLFNKLTSSLRQAKAIRAGTLRPARVTTLTLDHPAAVRSRLGLSQPEFAALIGVPLGTLRNWEQGHREPTGPAKMLLIVAAQFPREVDTALRHRGSRQTRPRCRRRTRASPSSDITPVPPNSRKSCSR